MEFADEDFMEYEQGCSAATEAVAETRSPEKLFKTAKSGRVQKRSTAEKRCTSCGTTTTPVWRWGGEAKETLLCNACSLRIRRSTGRPNRAKSAAERSAKKSQGSPVTSSNSGDAPLNIESPIREPSLGEQQEFHDRLRDILSKERDRLLGQCAAQSIDDLCFELDWPASNLTPTRSPLYPTDWDPFNSHLQYPFDSFTDTGRLDFASPAHGAYQPFDHGIAGGIF